jgi:hypothetical protein
MSYLKSGMTRKLLPTPIDIFHKLTPMRSMNLIKTPSAPRAAVFGIYYDSFTLAQQQLQTML